MEKLRLIISSIIKVSLLFLLVFWGAGRLDYWQGWGFAVLMLLTGASVFIIFKNKNDLLKERMKPGKGTKDWDKVFWIFHVIFYTTAIVVGILDGGRFLWTQNIPLWAYITSYIVFIIGIAITFWAMWTNNFFSSVVRIQKDRGHKVITGGPYKYVRHPGYVGASLYIIAMPIILGSLWAMIPAGLWILAIIIRTYLEDTTLQKELEGYKNYAKKTRYRLIPGIW